MRASGYTVKFAGVIQIFGSALGNAAALVAAEANPRVFLFRNFVELAGSVFSGDFGILDLRFLKKSRNLDFLQFGMQKYVFGAGKNATFSV